MNPWVCTTLIAAALPLTAQVLRPPAGVTLSQASLNAFLTATQKELDIRGLSLAMVQDGRVIYRYVGGLRDVAAQAPVTTGTAFEAASLSKPLFAWFVMKQVEKGLLDLDKPLCTYLPVEELKHDPRHQKITARMVLTHQSGMSHLRWFNPDQKLAIHSEPGTSFRYSTEGFNYLSRVIAHLNGLTLQTLDGLFQKEVGVPLGLAPATFQLNPTVEAHLAKGYRGSEYVHADYWDRYEFSGGGSLFATADSYAAFLIAITEGRGLKPRSLQALLKPQVTVPKEDKLHQIHGSTQWSLGFGVEPSPHGPIYTHGGNNFGYTCGFLVIPKARFGYVYFTNADQCDDLHRRLATLLVTPSTQKKAK